MSDHFVDRTANEWNSEWSMAEPFILTGQKWWSALEDKFPPLKDFVSSFKGSFEVSSLKATDGRAQVKLPEGDFQTEFVGKISQICVSNVVSKSVLPSLAKDSIGPCPLDKYHRKH